MTCYFKSISWDRQGILKGLANEGQLAASIQPELRPVPAAVRPTCAKLGQIDAIAHCAVTPPAEAGVPCAKCSPPAWICQRGTSVSEICLSNLELTGCYKNPTGKRGKLNSPQDSSDMTGSWNPKSPNNDLEVSLCVFSSRWIDWGWGGGWHVYKSAE